MADNLLIVESPGKIKKLTSILGPGWMVAASVGHIRDLPTGDIGVSPPEFKPRYELTIRGKEVSAKLKSLVASAKSVYLATDPDREGESIAWHLREVLGLKAAKRVTYGEITETAVRQAVAHPRALDEALASAQEARRVLDRLVGYMVSPLVSRKVGETASAGRVQSPAVRLVVEREREINKFQVTRHFSAQLLFDDKDDQTSAWSAEWQLAPEFVSEANPYFMDRPFAERVSRSSPVTVKSCKDSEARRAPPPPFTTSTLQQAASLVLKMDPKKTMELAQKLYEQGAITYHRTDSPNLSKEAFADIQAYASSKNLPVLQRQRTWKAKPGAQEAHEAIRASHISDRTAGNTADEQALYRLIRLRALASQLEEARYAVRTAILQGAALDGKPILFEARGRMLTFPGWLKATGGDQTDASGTTEPNNPVPALTAGMVLVPSSGQVLEKKTKPPARYTQASLVKKLETEEIGRPSTYASILDNITKRQYVRESKQFLYATPLGEAVVDSLVGTFSFVDLPFTRRMEQDLDAIAQGDKTYLQVIAENYQHLNQELANLAANSTPGRECPVCRQPTLYPAKSKKGLAYWSCQNTGCKAAFADAQGAPGAQFGAQPAADAPLCPICHKHGLIQATSKSGKPYWRCSGYPKCSALFSDTGGKPGTAFSSPAKTTKPEKGSRKPQARSASKAPKRTTGKRKREEDGLL